MAEHLDDRITGKGVADRQLPVDAQYYGGRVRIFAPAKFAFDAAQDDTLYLGDLPAHARLVETLSLVRHSAFGASVVLDIGLADDASAEVKAVNGGAAMTGKGAILASNLDVAAAGTKSGVAAIAIGDAGKKLWELAGLARDPGVPLKLVATFQGANPASGTLALEQGWVAD